MTSQKQDQEKRNLVVIDFDGTLFYNPNQIYSLNIPLEHVIDAFTFFNEFMFQTNEIVLNNTEFVLITGRHRDHEAYINHLLELKGFRFDQSFFNQMGRTTAIDESSFLIKYWTAKAKLINDTKLSNEYESIVIIDDDKILCSMLEKLNFRTFRTKINREKINQTLSITFNPPQKRLMTELQEICTGIV